MAFLVSIESNYPSKGELLPSMADTDADKDLTKSEPGIVKHCALPWAEMALTGLHS
jgi:hypothetical protein